MVSTEVLRRLAALLAETEKLPLPDRIIHMDPADRAGALTLAWDLRRKWKSFKRDLDDKTTYDSLYGAQRTPVAVEMAHLIESVTRFAWLQTEFLLHSKRPVSHYVDTLRAIEETRIAQQNVTEPDA